MSMSRARRPVPTGRIAALWLAAVSASAPGPVAAAEAVAWSGRMGARVSLVIDGQVRALGAGETVLGVRLLEVGAEHIVIDNAGQRQRLSLGGTPVRLAPGPTGTDGGARSLQIPVDADSHARTLGSINGRPVTLLVDTGASMVTMSAAQADALGLAWRSAPQVTLQTANGNAPAWRLTLDRVRLGEIDVYRVEALVVQQDLPVVLLGNSVLGRFDLRREAGMMVLTRRY